MQNESRFQTLRQQDLWLRPRPPWFVATTKPIYPGSGWHSTEPEMCCRVYLLISCQGNICQDIEGKAVCLSVCLLELIIWCKMVFQNLDTGVTGENVIWPVHIQSPRLATFDSTWKIVFYLHFSSQSCKMHNAQKQLFLIFSDNKSNI